MLNSASNFIRGTHFFLLGIRLILKPSLKRYLFVPILINFIILILTFSLLGYALYHSLQPFTAALPSWLMVLLGWLFWIVYGLISLLVGTLIFTLLANLIASPFYGLLAEATAKLLQKERSYSARPLLEQPVEKLAFYPLQNPPASASVSSDLSLKTILLLIPHSIGRELRKLLHFLPWILLCGLCLIFPLT